MSLRSKRRLRIAGSVLAALAIASGLTFAYMGRSTSSVKASPAGPFCAARPALCTETAEPWSSDGVYTGHDEPSMLFYSTVPGSGNNSTYQLTLPADPPTAPAQDGSGGTWSFMLHPAFWFGMIMCDDQSAPNPGAACAADSDKNILHSTDPTSPNYFGNTPGQGFMEMQFYPPNWGPVSCTDANGNNDGTWCAALNIDSFSSNSNTGIANNTPCLRATGQEYVNFAFITKDGVPVGPAAPGKHTSDTFNTTPDVLSMHSGDKLSVSLHDTAGGFRVDILDSTTGQGGYMVASASNGFGHPLYQPKASTCDIEPYTFHPMFSTSTPLTRVYWAAHSYNISFSDEIGHFEYCNQPTSSGRCAYPNATDGSRDSDDSGCATAPVLGTGVTLRGCLGTETDFDGPEYQAGTWPGSPGADSSKVTTPIQFTSPLFVGPGSSDLRNYQQAAFEADLPRIEGTDTSPNNHCQRHVSNPADPSPGTGCINPPNGATFYPIYTTTSVDGACVWQEGGGSIPGTIDNFGGTSTAEYGGLQLLNYPAAGYTITQRYNNFNNTLSNNPCLASGGKTS
jgi:hypothetical protein